MNLNEIKTLIYDLIKERFPGHERISIIHDVLALLSIELARPFARPPSGLINFRNGVLDVSQRTLLEHHPDFHFMHMVNVDYDSEVVPDERLKSVLLSFVKGDRRSLNILRAGVRRLIDPCMEMQTGFWIYGPPGTGKSTFLSVLRTLVGNRGVELSCQKTNLFERSRLLHALLVVIADGDFLNTETIRLLKLLIGRDVISYDLKHENVPTNFSFRYEGVVFVTSNQNISNAMLGVFDRAILDRFFQIQFPFVPDVPQPGLEKYLLNISALINCSLYVDFAVLQAQVRVGSYLQDSLEDNPFIDFIVTKLAPDPEGFISNSDLLDLLDEHFKENALPLLPSSSRRRIPAIVLDLLQTVCGCNVKNVRPGSQRGIKGVRIIDSTGSNPVEIKIRKENVFDIDPFEYKKIVNYDELNAAFEVQTI